MRGWVAAAVLLAFIPVSAADEERIADLDRRILERRS